MGKISQVVPVFLLNALWQAALIYAVAALCARLESGLLVGRRRENKFERALTRR